MTVSATHTSPPQIHQLQHHHNYHNHHHRHHCNHHIRQTLPPLRGRTLQSVKKSPSTSSPSPPSVQSTSCTAHTRGPIYTKIKTQTSPTLFTPVCSSYSCIINICPGLSRNVTQATLPTCPRANPRSICTLAVVIVGCHRMSRWVCSLVRCLYTVMWPM